MQTKIKNYVSGYAKAYAVIGERVILVDAGAKSNVKALMTGLQKAGVSAREVSLIVITHAHVDHIAPLPALKKITGASVLCHEDAAAALAAGWGEPVVPRTAFARFFTKLMPKSSEKNRRPFEADIAITGEFDLTPYGVAGTILHTPGHTSGSISIVLDSGEAIIGDLSMAFGPGRPKVAMIANDEEMLIASLRSLLDRGVHTFYLSHGGRFPSAAIERLVR